MITFGTRVKIKPHMIDWIVVGKSEYQYSEGQYLVSCKKTDNSIMTIWCTASELDIITE